MKIRVINHRYLLIYCHNGLAVLIFCYNPRHKKQCLISSFISWKSSFMYFSPSVSKCAPRTFVTMLSLMIVIDLGISKYSILSFVLCIHLLKISSWFSFVTKKLQLLCLLIGSCYSLSLTILHPWIFLHQLVSLARFSSQPEEGIFTWFRKLLQTHLTLWPRFPLTVIEAQTTCSRFMQKWSADVSPWNSVYRLHSASSDLNMKRVK